MGKFIRQGKFQKRRGLSGVFWPLRGKKRGCGIIRSPASGKMQRTIGAQPSNTGSSGSVSASGEAVSGTSSSAKVW